MKRSKKLYSLLRNLSRRGSSTMEYIVIIAAAVILAGILYVYISSDGNVNTTVQDKVKFALDGGATVAEGSGGPNGSDGTPNHTSPNSGDGKLPDLGKLPEILNPKIKDRLPTLLPGLNLTEKLKKLGEMAGDLIKGCAATEGDCPDKALQTLKGQKDKDSTKERSYTPTPDRPYGKLKDVKISDRQYAAFAQFAYADFEPGPNTPMDPKFLEKHLGKGWEEDIEYRSKKMNGFEAKVFINKETKEAVIAFTGTNQIRDIFIDAIQVAPGQKTLQHSSLDKMMEGLLKDPRYKDYQFTTTGHSLGGYLSMYAGVKYNMPTVTFNGPGYNNKDMHDAIYSDKYHDLIRNYNFGKDPIGSSHNKPGQTYNVRIDKNFNRSVDRQEHVKWFNHRPLKGLFSFGDHGIGNFTGITGSTPEEEARKIADENRKRKNSYSTIGELPGEYERDYERALKKKQKEYEENQRRVNAIFGPDGNIQGR